MGTKRLCKGCGRSIIVWNTLQTMCFDCSKKTHKPIAQKGRETRLYDTFRDKVAKPYLDKKFGHVCSTKGCRVTERLEVDHIRTRGAHHELKFDVKNLQYLCFIHHKEKTDDRKIETI